MLFKSNVFDTGSLHATDRQSAYLAAINHSLETEFLTQDFTASFAAHVVADQHVIALSASPRRSTRTRALINNDQQDTINFQYIVAGRAKGTTPGRIIDSNPDSFLLFDLSQPMMIEDIDHRTVINLALPRAQVASMIDDPGSLHGITVTGGTSVLLADLLKSVVVNLSAFRSTAGPQIAAMFREAIAVLLSGIAEAEGGLRIDSQSLLIDRALGLIQSRIGSRELTPDWLASKMNVSRSRLYKIFQQQGGVSKVIWRQRLESSRVALTSPYEKRRIGEIGYAYGFLSESHFARTFKAAFGVAPRVFRAIGRHEGMQQPIATQSQAQAPRSDSDSAPRPT